MHHADPVASLRLAPRPTQSRLSPTRLPHLAFGVAQLAVLRDAGEVRVGHVDAGMKVLRSGDMRGRASDARGQVSWSSDRAWRRAAERARRRAVRHGGRVRATAQLVVGARRERLAMPAGPGRDSPASLALVKRQGGRRGGEAGLAAWWRGRVVIGRG